MCSYTTSLVTVHLNHTGGNALYITDYFVSNSVYPCNVSLEDAIEDCVNTTLVSIANIPKTISTVDLNAICL